MGYSYIGYKVVSDDKSHKEVIETIKDSISDYTDSLKDKVEDQKERLKNSSVAKSLDANKKITDLTKEARENIN